MPVVDTLPDLLALALALGAPTVAGWSEQEQALAADLPAADMATVDTLRGMIAAGDDPLGDLFCELRSAEMRRPLGAIYTPPAIVASMLSWATGQAEPQRVVDPGTGSGRFLVAAGRQFVTADLLGVEVDPVAAILARGHLAAAGLAGRARVLTCDYRSLQLPAIPGQTLFLGNPPYVRHHNITTAWKQWLRTVATQQGLVVSQLAGLHVHFFLATRTLASAGDIGVFVTAAEWLDVNYGRAVRELLLGPLGLKLLQVIEPTLAPFPGTATTAVITGFQVESHAEAIAVQRVSRLEELHTPPSQQTVTRQLLATTPRWSQVTRPPVTRRHDYVELGELCRVHRGQATGANDVWILNGHRFALPASVLFPAVTRAKELIDAAGRLDDLSRLRCVIDLPRDLDALAPDARQQVERFLRDALAQGADKGYIASHRRPWWRVGLRAPAPILATYMARRRPVFVRNLAGARHINIAHGLYPREPLSDALLDALARFLNRSVTTDDGRVYAGGLAKFEPREMERLLVPRPEALMAEFSS